MDARLNSGHLGSRKLIGTAHQHHVRTAQLIRQQGLQTGEVVQFRICLALTLHCCGIPHHAARGQGFPIHHGHHAVHRDSRTDLRPPKRIQQRLGKGQSTGFNDDSIQAPPPLQQHQHHRQELLLHSATETAVGQLHHSGALEIGTAAGAGGAGGFCITDTAIRQGGAIQSHVAKFIDQHRQATLLLGEHMAEDGCFASAQEACDDGDGKLIDGGHDQTGCNGKGLAP